MISRGQWLILVLVVGAAITLTWRSQLETPDADASTQPDNQPDVYMEGAVVSQFDDSGALRYRLTAHRIAHYPERGTDQRPAAFALSAARRLADLDCACPERGAQRTGNWQQ